jgi:hypothetical protein
VDGRAGPVSEAVERVDPLKAPDGSAIYLEYAAVVPPEVMTGEAETLFRYLFAITSNLAWLTGHPGWRVTGTVRKRVGWLLSGDDRWVPLRPGETAPSGAVTVYKVAAWAVR